MKQLWITFALVTIFTCVYGQSDQPNLLKYWYYRDRLLKDFMTEVGGVGVSGASIPASIRQDYPYYAPNYRQNWGDATIDLSYYIGTLALEYSLLSKSGQNTDKNVEELYYAMETINRLDKNGDAYYNSTASSWLNGFFIRDDIGIDPNYDYLSQLNSKFEIPSTNHQPIRILDSDVIKGKNAERVYYDFYNLYQSGLATWAQVMDKHNEWMDQRGKAAESIDQIIHLMSGLAFVIKLIPNNVTYHPWGPAYGFNDGTTSLKQEAKNIIDRMVYYMHKDGFNWNWNIYLPQHNTLVDRGYSGYLLSFGFKYAQERLTGSSNTGSNNWISQLDEGAAKDLWIVESSLGPTALTLINNTEKSKILELKALGGSYVSLVDDIACGADPYIFYYISLMNSILNDRTVDATIFTNVASLLDEAPCEGPFNYGNQSSTYNWSSSSLLIHADARGEDPRPGGSGGNYNGLDFMFYYNLYRYLTLSDYKAYYSGLASFQNNDYPIINSSSPTTGFGSKQSPIIVESLNTITADNSIFSNGDVSYKAQASIDFNLGFEVYPGANFSAWIYPFECVDGLYERIAQKPSFISQSSEFEGGKVSEETPILLSSPNPNFGIGDAIFNSNLNCKGKITIYNQVGQAIIESKDVAILEGENKFPFDLTSAPNGIYIIKVEIANKNYINRIVKIN